MERAAGTSGQTGLRSPQGFGRPPEEDPEVLGMSFIQALNIISYVTSGASCNDTC